LGRRKQNTILTATALPGTLVVMFMILNIFLTFVEAATAVGVLTVLALFLLWTCVSGHGLFVGRPFDFGRHLCSSLHGHDVFAVVCGRSPLVVEVVLELRVGWLISFPFQVLGFARRFTVPSRWIRKLLGKTQSYFYKELEV
jgi:hypothetical protein